MTIVYIYIWWQFPHLYDLWNMNKWMNELLESGLWQSWLAGTYEKGNKLGYGKREIWVDEWWIVSQGLCFMELDIRQIFPPSNCWPIPQILIQMYWKIQQTTVNEDDLQIKITSVCSHKWWKISFVGSWLQNVTKIHCISYYISPISDSTKMHNRNTQQNTANWVL